MVFKFGNLIPKKKIQVSFQVPDTTSITTLVPANLEGGRKGGKKEGRKERRGKDEQREKRRKMKLRIIDKDTFLWVLEGYWEDSGKEESVPLNEDY